MLDDRPEVEAGPADPVAQGRAISDSVGRPLSAGRWAMLASLIATCKMSDVNPVAYLATTLRALLDGHPQSRIEDLMPWASTDASSIAAWGTARRLLLA
jgi:hypothetical protein